MQMPRYGGSEVRDCCICGGSHFIDSDLDANINRYGLALATYAQRRVWPSRINGRMLALARIGQGDRESYFATISGTGEVVTRRGRTVVSPSDPNSPPAQLPMFDPSTGGQSQPLLDTFLDLNQELENETLVENVNNCGDVTLPKIVTVSTVRYGVAATLPEPPARRVPPTPLGPNMAGFDVAVWEHTDDRVLVNRRLGFQRFASRTRRRIASHPGRMNYELGNFHNCALPKLLQYLNGAINSPDDYFTWRDRPSLCVVEVCWPKGGGAPDLATPCPRCRPRLSTLLCDFRPYVPEPPLRL